MQLKVTKLRNASFLSATAGCCSSCSSGGGCSVRVGGTVEGHQQSDDNGLYNGSMCAVTMTRDVKTKLNISIN